MAITSQEVAHVARLARLHLEPEELARMETQLSNILESIELLQEVDVTGVPPTTQVTGLTTVLRPDAVTTGLSREAALANAPAHNGEMFRVRAVFEE